MRRGTLVMVSGLLCLVTVAIPAVAGDWPTYRADAARSGYTAEPLAGELSLLWSCRTPHPPRPAWPTSDRIHSNRVPRTRRGFGTGLRTGFNGGLRGGRRGDSAPDRCD